MEISKILQFNAVKYRGSYVEPSKCPLCKCSIKPQELGLHTYKNDSGAWFLSAHYLCTGCYQTFVALHRCDLLEYDRTYQTTLCYCGPSNFEPVLFDERLTEMSPDFVAIYNQALSAENAGLDRICGMGYRKALEFLIKDYLIHKSPAERSVIEHMELGNCIANKITDEDLRAVASRCAWIGNDEAHYLKRFEEHDLETLKRLLSATAHWITMKLTTEFALEIEKRR